jgi:hypothetical protein
MAVRKHWILIVSALVSLLLCLAGLPWLLDRYVDLPANVQNHFHDVTAQQLNRDVRARLPLGSTRSSVEEVLRTKGMRFAFDSSAREIYANAPQVKGSNWLVYKSVGFTFQFDGSSKLKAIRSKIYLTGP